MGWRASWIFLSLQDGQRRILSGKCDNGSQTHTSSSKKDLEELPTAVQTRAPRGTALMGPLHKKEASLWQFSSTRRINVFVSPSKFIKRQFVIINKSSKPGKKITFRTSTATAIAIQRGNGSQFTRSLFSRSFLASHLSPAGWTDPSIYIDPLIHRSVMILWSTGPIDLLIYRSTDASTHRST